ncbi:MAG TPA: glycosyltransferase, partial [candidate division Zixibacteria bacterium]|nr:glycosyltransferase [candidate division Zixibacteria bacterium]
VVHVNSTRTGGGVAEILEQMIPAKQELGINARWEVITGDDEFYQATKSFHNALQGNEVRVSPRLLDRHIEVNHDNMQRLKATLTEADYVFIHDPQPAPLLSMAPNRKGKWIWRCHIDVSRPYRPIWRHLRQFLTGYDASVFSLANFAQSLPHVQYLIPPSIDPLSEKNREINPAEITRVREDFNLDPDRPLLTQVSRFDWFKDPVGVIQAYKQVRKSLPVQLVLAGGTATDDPEGAEVLAQVREAAGDDPDVHVLLLPPDAHTTINALQRASDIVIQKSTREGFGLTVTEAMWKGKPVIGGNTGGITLQVVDYHTGFLVDTPEGAAFRIRYLLMRPQLVNTMGVTARAYVRDHFLLTRHLRDYLTLILGLRNGIKPIINL